MGTEPRRTRPGPVAIAAFFIVVALLGALLWNPPRAPDPPAGWADVFDQVAPGVMLVQLSEPESRVGTGFAISADEIVTARHLILGAEAVRVRDLSGQTRLADVVGTDARTDLALLRVAGGSLRPVLLGSSDTLRVGDPVVAVGNPFGLGHSLSAGVVANRGRRLAAGADGPRVDFIQLSIPLNPGNSGGPVFDEGGRVIGVLAGTHTQGQGIAFAVPVEALAAGLPALRQGEHISRAFLGLRAARKGDSLVVDSVVPSGPADRGGIRPGDALTAVDGEQVRTHSELVALLDRLPGGRLITIRLLRDTAVVVVDVPLGDWAEQPVVVAGMTIRAAPGSAGEVVAVRPSSRSDRAGVRVGDVIRSVAGIPVRAPVDVRETLSEGGSATLELVRDGVALGVTLP